MMAGRPRANPLSATTGTDNSDTQPAEDTPAARPRGFTEGPVRAHLLRLGSFMAMGSVTMNIAQLAEAVYLGILGTEALAAMGFAFPLTNGH